MRGLCFNLRVFAVTSAYSSYLEPRPFFIFGHPCPAAPTVAIVHCFTGYSVSECRRVIYKRQMNAYFAERNFKHNNKIDSDVLKFAIRPADRTADILLIDWLPRPPAPIVINGNATRSVIVRTENYIRFLLF